LLRVENLKKVYTTGIFKKRWFSAVDNVSFSISSGETLGLVGESGCGKSTLGRVILRLIPPSDGRIFFKDRNVSTAGQRELIKMRAKMQIVFQHPESALNPRMRIYDSLIEPMRIQHLVNNRSEENKKANELIELVGLNKEHLNRYPHELSGGQIQRVVLARILSLQPEFIVADEPTSMLDVSVQAQVLNLFKDIQQQYHITYLFISHDLDVVRWMSDRIAVMYEGMIVEIGPAADVCENPQHPYTSLLVDSFSALGNNVYQNAVVPDAGLDKPPVGCKYSPCCSRVSIACNNKPDLKEVGKNHFVACWEVEESRVFNIL
jgi:oligopeptide/dipeptide ABC transporter ATP-binding protein